MSLDPDSNYTSEYADWIDVRPESDLMFRMLFYENRLVFNDDGEVSKIKKDIKFEVRVPVDAIAGLLRIIRRIENASSIVRELPKKPTEDDIARQNSASKKFFSSSFSEEEEFANVSDAKIDYIRKALGHWFDVK